MAEIVKLFGKPLKPKITTHSSKEKKNMRSIKHKSAYTMEFSVLERVKILGMYMLNMLNGQSAAKLLLFNSD